jgi:hypothetical protein
VRKIKTWLHTNLKRLRESLPLDKNPITHDVEWDDEQKDYTNSVADIYMAEKVDLPLSRSGVIAEHQLFFKLKDGISLEELYEKPPKPYPNTDSWGIPDNISDAHNQQYLPGFVFDRIATPQPDNTVLVEVKPQFTAKEKRWFWNLRGCKSEDGCPILGKRKTCYKHDRLMGTEKIKIEGKQVTLSQCSICAPDSAKGFSYTVKRPIINLKPRRMPARIICLYGECSYVIYGPIEVHLKEGPGWKLYGSFYGTCKHKPGVLHCVNCSRGQAVKTTYHKADEDLVGNIDKVFEEQYRQLYGLFYGKKVSILQLKWKINRKGELITRYLGKRREQKIQRRGRERCEDLWLDMMGDEKGIPKEKDGKEGWCFFAEHYPYPTLYPNMVRVYESPPKYRVVKWGLNLRGLHERQVELHREHLRDGYNIKIIDPAIVVGEVTETRNYFWSPLNHRDKIPNLRYWLNRERYEFWLNKYYKPYHRLNEKKSIEQEWMKEFLPPGRDYITVKEILILIHWLTSKKKIEKWLDDNNKNYPDPLGASVLPELFTHPLPPRTFIDGPSKEKIRSICDSGVPCFKCIYFDAPECQTRQRLQDFVCASFDYPDIDHRLMPYNDER